MVSWAWVTPMETTTISVAVPVGDETADRLIEKLIPRIEKLKVGPYTAGKDVDYGPVVTKAAKENILRLVESGVQQGAKLVTGADDILDDLPLVFRDRPELPASVVPLDLTADQTKILEAIGDEEASFDSVVATSGLTAAVASSTLLALEIRRLVKQLPGKRFVKLV